MSATSDKQQRITKQTSKNCRAGTSTPPINLNCPAVTVVAALRSPPVKLKPAAYELFNKGSNTLSNASIVKLRVRIRLPFTKKRRCGVHAELLVGPVTAARKFAQQFVVLQALIEAFFGEAGLFSRS